MQIKRPPFIVIVLVLAILLAGGYYLYTATRPVNSTLAASGAVEAAEILIAPEISGKVTEVLVNEGDVVKAGDVLFRLDDTMPQAQRNVTAANLDAAKASALIAQSALNTADSQYQIALEAALALDKKTRLQDWFTRDTTRFEQPNWYFSREEQLKSAEGQVEIALNALKEAHGNLENIDVSVEQSSFLKAEKLLLDARIDYQVVKNVNDLTQNSADADAPVGRYNSTHCGTNDGYVTDNKKMTNRIYTCTGDDQLVTAGTTLFDDAKEELDSAQNMYDELLGTQAADDVLEMRAEVSVAQERYYAALDYLRKFQTGEQSTAVLAAQGALSQSQAAAAQSLISIKQAQANLDLIDTQIAKLTITAPTDGMILTRAVEPGEVVMPGSGLLTMARMSDLTITVYIPEDRYGEISIGQTADVTVDSFPGETFTATVMYISDKAEFTPRNVQTAEGRKTTVFAVKLMLGDTGGKLPPGMPADVLFK